MTDKEVVKSLEEFRGSEMVYEQLSIFDYLPSNVDFPHLIANELIKYCERWGYNFIEQLKQQDGKQFYKIFCKITNTYFVCKSLEEYYEIKFSKDGKAVVKRCGKDFSDRKPDAVIDIQDVVNVLVQD